MVPSDLPADFPTFVARFGTDDACRDHLFTLRWPGGFVCAACGGRECYRMERRIVYECSACGNQHSLLAGTIFEQTKTGLSRWFLAIHLFLASKGGVSALELKRQLDFKSDQTAWTWLHKIRSAMHPRGGPLEGPVEVDETAIGGPEPGKRGRGAAGKTLVATAVETRVVAVEAPAPERLSGAARTRAEAMAERLQTAPETRRVLGRIRLAVIPDASAATLLHFVRANVAPGASVATDGWSGYRRVGRGGHRHMRIVLSAADGPAHEHLPACHLVFNLLKRLLIGTYHGGVGRHLARYLDEFVFRFNRKSLSPVARTLAVIGRALETKPLPNRMIFARS